MITREGGLMKLKDYTLQALLVLFGGVFESFFSIFSGERVSKKSKEISMHNAVNDF